MSIEPTQAIVPVTAADLVEALRNIRALAAKRQAEGGPDGCLTDIEGFARAALSRYAEGA